MTSKPTACYAFLILCFFATACDTPQKRKDVWDLYDVQPVASQPRDNDFYYTQPGNYNNCNTINDMASCGGG